MTPSSESDRRANLPYRKHRRDSRERIRIIQPVTSPRILDTPSINEARSKQANVITIVVLAIALLWAFLPSYLKIALFSVGIATGYSIYKRNQSLPPATIGQLPKPKPVTAITTDPIPKPRGFETTAQELPGPSPLRAIRGNRLLEDPMIEETMEEKLIRETKYKK